MSPGTDVPTDNGESRPVPETAGQQVGAENEAEPGDTPTTGLPPDGVTTP